MGDHMLNTHVYVDGVRVLVTRVGESVFDGHVPRTEWVTSAGAFTSPGGVFVFAVGRVCPGCLEVGDTRCPTHEAR